MTLLSILTMVLALLSVLVLFYTMEILRSQNLCRLVADSSPLAFCPRTIHHETKNSPQRLAEILDDHVSQHLRKMQFRDACRKDCAYYFCEMLPIIISSDLNLYPSRVKLYVGATLVRKALLPRTPFY
jgi:hypothetical protein